MTAPLSGLRIIEISAFVAAPLGGMTLAQLGAEVVRIDPIGGNIDAGRWPLAPNGESIYWASLNKGKRSVTLNLSSSEGQKIACDLITTPGTDAGILLTNLPAKGWMSYEKLRILRPDLIVLRLTGNHDGSSAVDYTVNCAGGFPLATGEGGRPVNHVLPAWDVAAGLYLATGLLAAERVRARTGKGQEITLALSDVMLATIGNLGYIGDVEINNAVRSPDGNHLYGAYGNSFPTKDNREVMVAAISGRQWQELTIATGLSDKLDMIGPMMSVDMTTEGGRYRARHAIDAVLAPWFAAQTLDEIGAAFKGSGVLWGPYQDFGQLVREDARCSPANPLFSVIDQPGIGRITTPRLPLAFSASEMLAPKPAPRIGKDGAAVLAEHLAMSAADIDALVAAGILGAT
jgi:2-methylfumaryl-CoA isomerase